MKRNRSILGVLAAFLVASLSLASCGSALSDFASAREAETPTPDPTPDPTPTPTPGPTPDPTPVPPRQRMIDAGGLHSLFVDGNGARPRLGGVEGEKKPLNANLLGSEPDKLLAKLDALMREEKPYRDPELTVGTLAREIAIPPRQLSELINHRLGTNFRNYVNAFRLEEVKRLLLEDRSTNILEAAFACGFNSKGNFNALFVKATGVTPREWRREWSKTTASV